MWWDRPIPLNREITSGWKSVLIRPKDDPLIAVGPFTSFSLFGGTAIYAGQDTSSPYHPQGIDGSLMTHFMRRGVARRLFIANWFLPVGHIFWLWDCYRPLKVQHSLYASCARHIAGEHLDWTPEQVSTEAQRFASLPSFDRARPSPHNTGGAIDLTVARLPLARWREAISLWWRATKIRLFWGDDEKSPEWAWKEVFRLEMELWEIYRREAKLLDMGTVFDKVSEATQTAYFERRLKNGELQPQEVESLRNRRLLYWTLRIVGISNYEEEWWHFDFGNQFWAKREGKTACYGAASLSDRVAWWEMVRRGNWHRTLHILAGQDITQDLRGCLTALKLSQSITPQIVRADPPYFKPLPCSIHLIYCTFFSRSEIVRSFFYFRQCFFLLKLDDV